MLVSLSMRAQNPAKQFLLEGVSVTVKLEENKAFCISPPTPARLWRVIVADSGLVSCGLAARPHNQRVRFTN